MDFYCAEKKIIIELDGAHHFTEEGRSYDAERDEYLMSLGYKTLRFSNSKIENELSTILDLILHSTH